MRPQGCTAFIENGYIWAETERREEVSYKPSFEERCSRQRQQQLQGLGWALVMHKNRKESEAEPRRWGEWWESVGPSHGGQIMEC